MLIVGIFPVKIDGFSMSLIATHYTRADEEEGIGTLMICLDLMFFIGSIVGTCIAIYLLWRKIKDIDKVERSKVVPVSMSMF